MRIITISREFGSGGRELGKRLADELGIAYYDKEILAKIAEQVYYDQFLASEMTCEDWYSLNEKACAGIKAPAKKHTFWQIESPMKNTPQKCAKISASTFGASLICWIPFGSVLNSCALRLQSTYHTPMTIC